jgi:hypothetical protein
MKELGEEIFICTDACEGLSLASMKAIPVMSILSPDEPHCYCTLANDFLKASESLYANNSPKFPTPLWPTFSCVCQAIELYLKAYLRIQGISAGELKRWFGHDLQALFDKATQMKLNYDSIEQLAKYIPLISEPHKDREFQYVKSGEWELPYLGILLPLVQKLAKKVDY